MLKTKEKKKYAINHFVIKNKENIFYKQAKNHIFAGGKDSKNSSLDIDNIVYGIQ
ncbi:MAG: hypothetical protein PHH06_00840 [Candidatus Gracilibacteria bacterium]|nr:hypothetical protein [Candidatus Gracilibacteria bacterium]